ncbi:MAG TPA: hypothetical protein VMW82_00755 [Candidatus Paceibacterota bacterium]|nr:hypothetical protein [Candidatus Paceibacterota bacterium]
MAVWRTITSKNLSFGLRFDPEFYHPDFFLLRNDLEKIGVYTIGDVKDVIGYGLQAKPDYLDSGVDYIRALNLKEFGISEEILKIGKYQIPSGDYISKEGDILITRSGANCGDTGVIENGFIGATYGSYIIRIRVKKLNPFFVFAFLQSKFGRFQTIQIRTGLAQPNLSIPYIENLIQIPKNFSEELQAQIEKLIKDAFRKQREVNTLYQEAEQELLERMGWYEIDTKHILDYQTTSKDVFGNGRIDPEFYQPKFVNLINHLNKIGSRKIGGFCAMPNRGVQPLYDENGEFLVINSKHLGTTEIDIQSAEKTTERFYNENTTEKARLNKYDVLMYSTGAYVGRTNTYLEDAPGIANNHVSIIRPEKKICNPLYLALFLNSKAGLMQTDQRASGSAQREIYPQDIVKYDVFIPEKNNKPDLEWQEKLADKIIQAYEAKNQAKQKLQEAKELVEDEIGKLIN